MPDTITTRDVCIELKIPESALRHALRRPGAPRPRLHPTAKLFLWTKEDIEKLRSFLALGHGRTCDRSPDGRKS